VIETPEKEDASHFAIRAQAIFSVSFEDPSEEMPALISLWNCSSVVDSAD
jgi:hypothetical protein